MWDVIILVLVVVVVVLFFVFGPGPTQPSPSQPQKVSFHPDPELQQPLGFETAINNEPISWNDAYQSTKSQNDLTGQLGDGMPVPWLQALETVSKTFTGPPGGPMYHGELPLSEPY